VSPAHDNWCIAMRMSGTGGNERQARKPWNRTVRILEDITPAPPTVAGTRRSGLLLEPGPPANGGYASRIDSPNIECGRRHPPSWDIIKRPTASVSLTDRRGRDRVACSRRSEQPPFAIFFPTKVQLARRLVASWGMSATALHVAEMRSA